MFRYLVQTKIKAGADNKVSLLYKDYCDWFADNDTEKMSNPRVKWQKLLEENPEGPSVVSFDCVI